LVYFMVIWYLFQILVCCTKKIWQPCCTHAGPNSACTSVQGCVCVCPFLHLCIWAHVFYLRLRLQVCIFVCLCNCVFVIFTFAYEIVHFSFFILFLSWISRRGTSFETPCLYICTPTCVFCHRVIVHLCNLCFCV
jgi:hypothetical protein